ncbi:hypothetical protein DL95DRAFT_416701 [Leptodontidium sp. 2 PMI_412]|nr:hypothetical protein DL95DRAFT_416701 [Leptodontidium sp. 2 PMI_412]
MANIENLRPLKVGVIGAGYSGIYLGIRIPQRLRNIDFQIHEKNDAVGGVRYENRYPGCGYDILAHSYQFSFASNPNWSEFYAGSSEISEYLQSTARSLEWTDSSRPRTRHITVEKTATREISEEAADIVIAARGILKESAWPKTPGINEFRGEKIAFGGLE